MKRNQNRRQSLSDRFSLYQTPQQLHKPQSSAKITNKSVVTTTPTLPNGNIFRTGSPRLLITSTKQFRPPMPHIFNMLKLSTHGTSFASYKPGLHQRNQLDLWNTSASTTSLRSDQPRSKIRRVGWMNIVTCYHLLDKLVSPKLRMLSEHTVIFLSQLRSTHPCSRRLLNLI